MNIIAPYYPDAQTLISEGWKLLVEQLGIQKATQFVVLLERGKGDSVKEIADYWGNSSIEDIYQRVKIWKSQEQTA
ncbi:MAG TPA: hypothetical protein DCQ37_17570 [Desulfobacteraceae bacterium]|jgi:hypothetical protein|nr:hypothetical protein [Desulfobacteraceae bacterium]